ncbi:MAG: hypothetical protein EBR01_03010 [Proteobacteria bacterium]|nr:hypothetical protein [Pseudomonadota bacterium]
MRSYKLIWARKYCLRRFKLPIITLLLVEALLVAWWTSSKPVFNAVRGHLVKNGNQYVVFWINDEKQQAMIALDNLSSAVSFVRDELKLDFATNTLEHPVLESLWMKSNVESVSLFWKTTDSEFLNRLTFASYQDAEVFRDLFSRGAYSRSPIGHSLALKASKKN